MFESLLHTGISRSTPHFSRSLPGALLFVLLLSPLSSFDGLAVLYASSRPIAARVVLLFVPSSNMSPATRPPLPTGGLSSLATSLLLLAGAASPFTAVPPVSIEAGVGVGVGVAEDAKGSHRRPYGSCRRRLRLRVQSSDKSTSVIPT